MLGSEANYAGMSFLTLDKLNHLRYGSDLVNAVCDARIEHGPGMGTFAFDDEGVPAQSADIIRNGQFVGYMTSRETAAAIGQQRSNGTMRATGWARLPLIRMTNVSLLPGEQTLEEVFGGVSHAIYMETNRSWSIDDKRYNFQFGCEIAWEIKDGKRVRMLKNPTYSGITTEFWNSCAAIANRDHWVLWGVPNCGKGQPEQVIGTGHGASPARFHNIKVGSRVCRMTWTPRFYRMERMPRAVRHRRSRPRSRLGVSDVEALFGAHRGALTRFANNTIHQNVAEQDRWLSVRVALDHKTARATTNRFDPDSIRRAVEQALALARSVAPDPDLLPLAPSLRAISEIQALRSAHRRRHARSDRARAVAEAIRIVESAGQTAAGIYSTGQSVEAIFNSRGVAAWHAETHGAVFDHRHGRAIAPDGPRLRRCRMQSIDPVDAGAQRQRKSAAVARSPGDSRPAATP